jgi:hypothetical protein
MGGGGGVDVWWWCCCFGIRGGWCCLGEKVEVFVVVVVGDSFWRSSLFFEFIFIVATSCSRFELLRCLWCFEDACPSS